MHRRVEPVAKEGDGHTHQQSGEQRDGKDHRLRRAERAGRKHGTIEHLGGGILHGCGHFRFLQAAVHLIHDVFHALLPAREALVLRLMRREQLDRRAQRRDALIDAAQLLVRARDEIADRGFEVVLRLRDLPLQPLDVRVVRAETPARCIECIFLLAQSRDELRRRAECALCTKERRRGDHALHRLPRVLGIARPRELEQRALHRLAVDRITQSQIGQTLQLGGLLRLLVLDADDAIGREKIGDGVLAGAHLGIERVHLLAEQEHGATRTCLLRLEALLHEPAGEHIGYVADKHGIVALEPDRQNVRVGVGAVD